MQAIKEVVIGISGPGKTFGDIDAYKDRRYMYTLRTFSRDVRIWQIDAKKFLMYVKSHGRDNVLMHWQK